MDNLKSENSMQKIFILKKDISSPQFTRVIKAGRVYTETQIKDSFPHLLWSKQNPSLAEWFDDVSDQFEINNCRIVLRKL